MAPRKFNRKTAFGSPKFTCGDTDMVHVPYLLDEVLEHAALNVVKFTIGGLLREAPASQARRQCCYCIHAECAGCR